MKRQHPENGHAGTGAHCSKNPSSKRSEQQKKKKKQSMPGDLDWSESDHRDFVTAIFEIGLKNSSPSALLEFMAENDDLTVERIKSRLQKFRLKREESKAEFLSSYDDIMARYKSDEAVSGLVPTYGGVRNQSAEPAAFLTQATIAEGSGRPLPFNPEPHGAAGAAASGAGSGFALSSQPCGRNTSGKSLPIAALSASPVVGAGDGDADAANTNDQGEVGGAPLRLPDLTEEERNAPIGRSFNHLMGLFASLKDNLLKQRAEVVAYGGVEAQNNDGANNEMDESAADAASTAVHVNGGAGGSDALGGGINYNGHKYVPHPSQPGALSAIAGSANTWGQGN